MTINSPSWDITLVGRGVSQAYTRRETHLERSATPRILAQITLLMPTGEIHMIPLTIFMMTSSMILKKLMTGSALRPIEPRTVPKVRQKKMMPKVFVPDLEIDMMSQQCRQRVSLVP